MCGIVGFISRSGRRAPGADRLAHMRDTMPHRGPDSAGLKLLAEGKVGLAHRRLAIVDLTPAGDEPMPYADGRLWLTFNGEIYNAAALRRELASKRCSFRSACDAEVVLAAYATWGTECVQRFNGMWAFAIWDQQKQTLFCSRDRFGIKPFYLYDDGDIFIFASEMRAILASGRVRPRPYLDAIAHYFRSDLVDGLEPTFFQDIRRLPAAHSLTISEHGTKAWRYWDLEVAGFADDDSLPSEAVQRVRNALDDAVRSHLVSDAPLGVSLSGGLDSSSILALASQTHNEPVRTFTSWFDAPGPYDERRYSDRMIDMYGAQAFTVHPDPNRLFEILPSLVWHLEEPPLPHGVFPRWHVADLAGRQVKVLLAGQGGDELLAGYEHHLPYLLKDYRERGRMWRYLRERKAASQKPWLRIAGSLPRKALRRVRRTAHSTSHPPRNSWMGTRLHGVDPARPVMRQAAPHADRSWLNERLYFDAVHGVLPTLLKYEDKIDMAFSVEGRVPLLDHRLAELIFSLPPSAKIHKGWTKFVMRVAMEGALPPEIQWRRDKVGFPTPYSAWFNGPLLQPAEARIMDGELTRAGYADRSKIEMLIKGHRAGQWDISSDIWKWLCFSIWIDVHTKLDDTSYSARPSR